MTDAALDQFQANMDRVRHLGGLISSLKVLTTDALDLSDLLRAQLVLAVSALDHFIHEYVRLGMIEVQKGNRPQTDAFLAFKVPLAATQLAISDASGADWLDTSVREAHSWLSFQQPEKVAGAIRLVSKCELWNEVGKELEISPAVLKAELKLIVDRRNKIAHEADIDPSNPPFRWPVDAAMVDQAVEFLDRLCKAIYKVAR